MGLLKVLERAFAEENQVPIKGAHVSLQKHMAILMFQLLLETIILGMSLMLGFHMYNKVSDWHLKKKCTLWIFIMFHQKKYYFKS